MKELNAAIDTNVFVAALLGSRPASLIYKAFRRRLFVLSISKQMFAELEDVLSRPELKINDSDKEELLSVIKIGACISDVTLKVSDCRDPKDNVVLACALESKVDCLVTCDRDLLVLNPYHNIAIISPTKFLHLLRNL